jgi:hypothetical protein
MTTPAENIPSDATMPAAPAMPASSTTPVTSSSGTTSISGNTKVQSLAQLQTDPSLRPVYLAILQGIAMNILQQMQDGEAQLEKDIRDAEERAAGG